MLWDLAEAISITTFRFWKNNIGKGGIKYFFKGGDYLKRGINTLCELYSGVKGQKEAQNGKTCLLYSISQEVFIMIVMFGAHE